MASAIAMTPPAAKKRPHSALDTLFDVLGNAVARFDSLTGARINAKDVNSKLIDLGHGAARAAETVKNAYKDLYKGPKDPKNGSHRGWLDRGADAVNGTVEWAEGFFNRREIARLAKNLARNRWSEARKLFRSHFPAATKKFVHYVWQPAKAFFHGAKKFFRRHFPETTKKFIRNVWGPAKKLLGNPVGRVARLLRSHFPLTWRIGKWALRKIGPRLERVSTAFDRWLGPANVIHDVYKTVQDVRHKNWWSAGGDAIATAWDYYYTAKAWGAKQPYKWLGSAARWTGRTILRPALRGIGTAARLGARFLVRRAFPWIARMGPRIGARLAPLAERYLLPLAERYSIPVAEQLATKGPYGALAAAGILLAAGGLYAYYHPKETKKFFHNIGGFFHNVGVGLTGTAKQKAQSGWHPWADLTASTLKVGWDVLSRKGTGALEKDASSLGHAFNKITGAELPPGVKRPPPPPPKSWREKGWGFLRNVVIPSIPLVGDNLGDSIDQGSELWRMYQNASKASRPHGPVPRAPATTRLHAPMAVRSPRPRPQSANNHSKTQAEIRVRFENAPPGTKLGTRVTGGGASIFQTGLAFAN